jgi:hypothetical protein
MLLAILFSLSAFPAWRWLELQDSGGEFLRSFVSLYVVSPRAGGILPKKDCSAWCIYRVACRDVHFCHVFTLMARVLYLLWRLGSRGSGLEICYGLFLIIFVRELARSGEVHPPRKRGAGGRVESGTDMDRWSRCSRRIHG